MECESCQATETYTDAYDDTNFWLNVVPKFPCPKCGKSSEDLDEVPEDIHTKYPEGFQI
jgi:predicted nucleic-acid-binding Zn-ribbon protein